MYIHTCVDTVLARRAAIHVVVHSAPLPASRSGIGDSFDIYIYIYIYSHVYIYIYIYMFTLILITITRIIMMIIGDS